MSRPFKVVTLCGSLNHNPKELWDRVAMDFSLDGYIVLKVDVWGIRDKLHSEPVFIEKKEMLDELHKYKILMSSEVFVLDSDGYIGPSTRSEIVFAENHNKKVTYMSKTGRYTGENGQYGQITGGDEPVIYQPSRVDSTAKIGKRTLIGAFCDIGRNVVVGEDCNIQCHVTVSDGCVVGDRVRIGPNVSLLNDKYMEGDREKLLPVRVGDGVRIGGGAVVLPDVGIADGAFIGAGAVVTKDVGKDMIVYGESAKTMKIGSRSGLVTGNE